jgi:hypothetical protein
MQNPLTRETNLCFGVALVSDWVMLGFVGRVWEYARTGHVNLPL